MYSISIPNTLSSTPQYLMGDSTCASLAIGTNYLQVALGTLFTIGQNDYSTTWAFDTGGIHMEMPQAKDQNGNGGYGSIKIFTNNTHNEVLQGTIALCPNADASQRHLRVECIEQGTAYRPVVVNPSGGNMAIGKLNPTCKLEIAEQGSNSSNIETISIEGGNLANNWERSITFTGNNRSLEVGQISCWLSGLERQIRIKTTNGLPAASFDNSTAARDTRFILYDVDTGTMKRVSVGDPNTGGAGYKVLRIPN